MVKNKNLAFKILYQEWLWFAVTFAVLYYYDMQYSMMAYGVYPFLYMVGYSLLAWARYTDPSRKVQE